MQVIVFTNENGGVSVCVPTGELTIEEVKVKDTPEHSIIVDDSTLPKEFFNAWELNNGTIRINLEKAKAFKLSEYNTNSLQIAQARQLNTLANLPNTPDDATWQVKLASDRTAIASATTIEQLVEIKQ